jgi:pimeloyl-ACP methyl ester carboxylesterase
MTDVIFLPGIIAPAALRYAALLEHLPKDVNPVLKDLEVYATDSPPPRYSIETEVQGIDAKADKAGLDRFHIYAHSGGGACSLAYVAAHPDRIISLAVDEPASDFSEEDQNDPYQDEIRAAASLPEPEGTRAFLRLQVAEGVEIPQPMTDRMPDWMASRPAGIPGVRGSDVRVSRPALRLRALSRPGAVHSRDAQPSAVDRDAGPLGPAVP